MYALHGVWLAIHFREMKGELAEIFPTGNPGAHYNLVSLLQMMVDEAPQSILAIAGAVLALWRGRGALRVVLVILGLALWAAYAWVPVFLM